MTDQTESNAETEKLKLEVAATARKRYKEVIDQREEIMTAFVAKFKCEPEEMVQVQWNKSASEILWFLVRKSDCIYCEKCRDLIAEGKPKEIPPQQDQ